MEHKNTLPSVAKTNLERINGRASLLLNPGKDCTWAIRKGPCKFCAFWKCGPAGQGLLFEDAIKALKDKEPAGRWTF